ncbi:hypothetical protein GOBAR_AA30694 [Gossypium barbadense]|uniref:Uncharacterized protein n=1 Tax=Gossypium barbadense TaxID=3634 RepID=A0A2P5WFX1_GOSBA|nr:hypothetical protein GOBAR_AA30694 [Gossypium barbadense]
MQAASFNTRHFSSIITNRYSLVIERFQRREGLKEMIKGVIFYSGSADLLNPKVITLCISSTSQSKVSIFQILVVFVLVWSNGNLASIQHVSSISCPHLMFQRLWLSPEAIFARMEYNYLYICINWFHLHFDEAFSSLRIANYKSFTRFHINRDGDLEVFTLVVDKIPREWMLDPDWDME